MPPASPGLLQRGSRSIERSKLYQVFHGAQAIRVKLEEVSWEVSWSPRRGHVQRDVPHPMATSNRDNTSIGGTKKCRNEFGGATKLPKCLSRDNLGATGITALKFSGTSFGCPSLPVRVPPCSFYSAGPCWPLWHCLGSKNLANSEVEWLESKNVLSFFGNSLSKFIEWILMDKFPTFISHQPIMHKIFSSGNPCNQIWQERQGLTQKWTAWQRRVHPDKKWRCQHSGGCILREPLVATCS